MNTWVQVLEEFRARVGNCTASDFSHVFEISVPLASSWFKGTDPKGNPSRPTFCYAVLLRKAMEVPKEKLCDAFSKALDQPGMSSFREKSIANRSLEYKDLVDHEPSALQVFTSKLYEE
jgi:hypothetical protein